MWGSHIYQLTDEDIKEALNYVRWVCRRYDIRRCQDIEECESRAMLNLVMAAGRYRGDRGATFKTYVRQRLWGTVIDYLRYLKRLSVEIGDDELELL